jgi:hypothetical protein
LKILLQQRKSETYAASGIEHSVWREMFATDHAIQIYNCLGKHIATPNFRAEEPTAEPRFSDPVLLVRDWLIFAQRVHFDLTRSKRNAITHTGYADR